MYTYISNSTSRLSLLMRRPSALTPVTLASMLVRLWRLVNRVFIFTILVQFFEMLLRFLHSPQVLILDEPLNGLDPRSARRLKDLFGELAANGTAILAQQFCSPPTIWQLPRLSVIASVSSIVDDWLAEGSASELQHLAAVPDKAVTLPGIRSLTSIIGQSCPQPESQLVLLGASGHGSGHRLALPVCTYCSCSLRFPRRPPRYWLYW